MKSLPPPEVPSFSSPFFYRVGVATLGAPGSPSFTMVLYYRPPTKFLESNVFGHLCLSFCSRRGWGHVTIHDAGQSRVTQGHQPVSHLPSPYRDPPGLLTIQDTPSSPLPTYSTWTSRCRDPPPSCIDIFKRIHYVVWAVGKRAVSIRLKCLFVTICNVFTRVCNSVHREGGSLFQYAPQVTWPGGPQGGLCPRGVSVRETPPDRDPHTVTSGRYASC